VPHPTTLMKLTTRCGTAAVDGCNQALLAKATEIAIEDVAIIPSHYQVNTWSARKGLKYKARSDEYTLATHVSER